MNDINYNYRIYGRSKGRKKISLIDQKFYKKIIFNPKYDISKNTKNILDIGSGNGENTIYLAEHHPDTVIVACDKYYDGNINLCNQLINLKINNVKIYNNNVNKFLDEININNYFNEIWILFPDPWPKKRHNKRRIISSEFLERLCFTLKKSGRIFIATDNSNYFLSIMMKILKLDYLKWENDRFYLWENPFDNMVKTVFYLKAKKNGEKPVFISLKKNI